MTLHPRVCVTNGGGTAQRANARARDGTLLGLGKLSILTAIRRRVFLTVYSSLESPRRRAQEPALGCNGDTAWPHARMITRPQHQLTS